MCISESWADKHFADSVFVRNEKFQCIRSDRDTRGGGVMMLVPENLKIFGTWSINTPSIEALTVSLKFASKIVKLMVVYRPPGNDPNFVKSFKTFLDSSVKQTESVIITGDFNLPEINWQELTTTVADFQRDFLHFCLQNSFIQAVLEPTRDENIIDLVLTNEPNVINLVKIIPPFSSSDHCQVLIWISIPKQRILSSQSMTRDYSKTNFYAAEQMLASVSWPDMFSSCISINDFHEVFCNTLNTVIEMFVPLKSMTNVKKKWPSDVSLCNVKKR